MTEVPNAREIAELRHELLRQRDLLIARPGANATECYPDKLDRAAHLSQLNSETSLKNQAGFQLNKIAAALGRMKLGQYGLCAECDEPIGVRRLRANPAAIYCLVCQCSQQRRQV